MVIEPWALLLKVTAIGSKENVRRGSAKVSSCNSKQPLLLAVSHARRYR
jgi:hypothetical protein